ncbi:MAG TPA: histidinol phosphate phosphatase domain-containing protein [Thermoplasmata archaeon]|jgi:histidinol phosphatase-like PHP family hydrolase|nr:histidinol phosphate phosphatase domain-containing protein [Thermoplasmata archaeon]HYB78713.1 histidinol phosphate phosphatase domain-containing protein [Thermoplasmata archaeon]
MIPRPLDPDPAARRADFHSHSYLTDGESSPIDMWLEAQELEHRALALTDHLGPEDPRPLLDRLHQEAKVLESTRFVPIVGVELTKIPPRRIADQARAARKAGAEIVIVHGETIVEHVPAGTNHAAIDCGLVDVLAHPGLLDPKDAELARAQSVVLEISGRDGHSLANGHVVRLALEVGAELVVDSDAHDPEHLIPLEHARRIAQGAGVPEKMLPRVLFGTPTELIKRTHGG